MEKPTIITIGSGKGGVGKSSMVANIGTLLAHNGHNVGFIDADMGGANLHQFLGIRRPAKGLQDFLAGREPDLKSVVIETSVPNTWLISGASDILELANPRFGQKQKIITQLKKLTADYILIDLGAGADTNVVDFFAAFPIGILVTDSLPTSIENAYGYLKNGIIRGVSRLFPGRNDIKGFIRRFSDPRVEGGFITFTDFIQALRAALPREAEQITDWLIARRTFFIMNMVKNQEDVVIGKRFTDIVKKYLSIKLYFIGSMVATPDIPRSIREMKPALDCNPSEQTNSCITGIVNNLLALVEE
jgi:flagellar biosynthesis protein FlhG